MSDLHLHFHAGVGAGATLIVQVPSTGAIAAQLQQLKELLIMDMQALKNALDEVSGALTSVGTQLDEGSAQLEKATNEIILAVQNSGQTSPEVDAALTNLKAAATALSGKGAAIKQAAQTLDDLNQDAA